MTSIVDLARRAGMNVEIHPTPAVALGAYEVTPLEIAGAYTIFRQPWRLLQAVFCFRHRERPWVHHLRQQTRAQRCAGSARGVFDGPALRRSGPELARAPAWGRAASIFPFAGKTGTSHDGWFAGFTSKLICVVWVGFDDNRELNLEGAHSALPVWAEFMKRAHEHREYRNVSEFEAPAGVVGVQIDPASGQLATAACPKVRTEYFIEGTQPWSNANCTVAEECAWRAGIPGSRREHPTRIRAILPRPGPSGSGLSATTRRGSVPAARISPPNPRRNPNVRVFSIAFGVYSNNCLSESDSVYLMPGEQTRVPGAYGSGRSEIRGGRTMASRLWLAALSFGTVQMFLPAVSAQSATPSSGFLSDTATGRRPRRPNLVPALTS